MASSSTPMQDLIADILTGIADGVVVTDVEGHVLIWNRAAEEMTGIAATDALGKNIHAVFSENPTVTVQIEKTFSTGRSYSDYESELVVKHSSPVPVGLVTSTMVRPPTTVSTPTAPTPCLRHPTVAEQ